MSESGIREGRATQECPICGATQLLSARTCSICGAVLPGERTPILPPPTRANGAESTSRPRYDPALGDDDLYAGDLSGRMWRLLLLGGILLALVVGVGAGVVIGQMGDDDDPGAGPNAEMEDLTPRAGETLLPSLTPGAGDVISPTAPPTATPRAPSRELTQTAESFGTLPTVTPLPPSATPTPTPGPCMQTASSNDTVLGMAMRCGHKDMAIIDLILELNGMDSPQELQLGQTLEIPWPTPTAGPPTEAPEEATPADSAATMEQTGSGSTINTVAANAADATRDVTYNEFGTPDALAYYQNLEPTLRPGLAWHTVLAGETILSVAYQYETSVETLSQINPEIPFRQCDYGLRYGGENCSVMLIEGQQVRVPVPIPTSTPMPTPDGTRTPTPSPTPTYNAPYTLKPENGAAFMADQIVTLRWGSTGTLGDDERYVVRVNDLEGYEEHIAFTEKTSYQLPGGWQPGDGRRHTFEWSIAVAEVDEDLNIINEKRQTKTRRFTWESR